MSLPASFSAAPATAAPPQEIELEPPVPAPVAIKSVSPYILYKQNTSTGVAIVIDPDFMRGLSIRLGARLFNWANLNFGSEVYVDARTLDTGSDGQAIGPGASVEEGVARLYDPSRGP